MPSESSLAKPVKMVGAVEQAFRILRVLAAAAAPLGVSAIAREAQVNPSTAFNILRTLVAERVVSFDELSKTYTLGSGLLDLSRKLHERSVVHEIRGDLNKLAAETNCLVGLWQCDEGRMILIERAVGGRAIRLDMDIKQRLPTFAGAVGRAYAAACRLTDAQIREGFKPLRWVGEITAKTFIAEVREAERNGYALDRETLYPGVVSIGSIILDREGTPIFGLTASDIANNLDEQRIKRVGEEMASLARAYSG